MIEQASNYADKVDFVFDFIFWVSGILLVGIVIAMIYFAYRFYHKRNPVAKQIGGHTGLEITWTVIPTIIVMIMFYYGYDVFKYMRTVPEGARIVNVTGQMWRWTFEYPERGIKTDKLYLEKDKPYKLVIHSLDVIHSLFIPAFRVKEDAVPGIETYISVTPIKTGEFDIFCAEYCGLDHSKMLSKAIVLESSEYQKKLKELASGKPLPKEVSGQEGGDLSQWIARGKEIVESRCATCHSLDGSRVLGPTFKGLYGHKVVVVKNGQEKEVVADDEYIKRSINQPMEEIVKDYPPVMPPQGLSDDEIQAVIEFLKTLK